MYDAARYRADLARAGRPILTAAKTFAVSAVRMRAVGMQWERALELSFRIVLFFWIVVVATVRLIIKR